MFPHLEIVPLSPIIVASPQKEDHHPSDPIELSNYSKYIFATYSFCVGLSSMNRCCFLDVIYPPKIDFNHHLLRPSILQWPLGQADPKADFLRYFVFVFVGYNMDNHLRLGIDED